MLAADVTRFGGANQDLLWRAFAQRGFGQLASVTSNGDTDPVPDFSSPVGEQRHARVPRGFAGRRPAAGEREHLRRRLPGPRHADRGHRPRDDAPNSTRPRSSSRPKRQKARATRAYNFIANAPGYGHVRFAVKKLEAGETRDITIRFPTNFASTARGATASGDGTGQANLIDDNEGTNWGATGAPVEGRQVVVALAGQRPLEGEAGQRLGAARPGPEPLHGLALVHALRLLCGRDPANPTCDGAIAAGWSEFLRSRPTRSRPSTRVRSHRT